jgi:AcrR family transcriptional regulator
MTEEQESRRRILDAAFAEFADKGFRGATIKSIAQRAGLQSPSLIYWYFPTKEALFQATIELRSPFTEAIFDPSPFLDRPPNEFLPQLAQSYLELMSQADVQKMARLFFSETGKRPQLADLVSQGIIEPALDFLKAYLEHQVNMGRLRPHDVRSSARAFMGMLLPQTLGMVLFPHLRADGLANETHVQNVIDIFLTGLQAETEG